jgi:hypothetical protein
MTHLIKSYEAGKLRLHPAAGTTVRAEPAAGPSSRSGRAVPSSTWEPMIAALRYQTAVLCGGTGREKCGRDARVAAESSLPQR